MHLISNQNTIFYITDKVKQQCTLQYTNDYTFVDIDDTNLEKIIKFLENNKYTIKSIDFKRKISFLLFLEKIGEYTNTFLENNKYNLMEILKGSYVLENDFLQTIIPIYMSYYFEDMSLEKIREHLHLENDIDPIQSKLIDHDNKLYDLFVCN